MTPAIDVFAAELEIPQRERLFDSLGGRDQRNRRIQEAHETYRYTIGQIARHLGLGRSTIARALPRPAPPAVPEN